MPLRFALSIVALPLLLLLSGCGGSGEEAKKAAVAAAAAAKPEPLAVSTVPAEVRKMEQAILVTGSLLPDETVTMVSEVPGRITAVHYDFGQSVRKGAVIAELDKTEYQLQVNRSKAALTQALARLGLDPGQAGQQPSSTPAMRQARAQLEDARSKLDSAERLVKTGDIAKERFTETEKAYRARQAAFDAAQDEMRTLLASVEALRAEVSLAEKRLSDTVIRAPFDATVSEKRVSTGQYVKDSVPLLVLVKTSPLRLRLEVPESAAGIVRAGTQLQFTTDAAPGDTFSATVRQLNPSLNEQSRTLIAEARFNSNDARLRPGMFVQVRLILARGVETIVVPKQAVYSVAGLTKVFSVKEGKLVEHKVTPGEPLGDWITVPAGTLNPGDPVVVSNLPQLFNGQPVTAKQGKV
jgi:RND family efflux transporter MFP subunit